MAKTIYPQSFPFTTTNVGELRKMLEQFDPNEQVVFASPIYGAFGNGTMYSLEKVERKRLERKERHYPAYTGIDEETGEPFEQEAYTQVWEEWTGIVIS